MFKGLMVVNAFLRTTKFDDLYHTLLEAAQKAKEKVVAKAKKKVNPVKVGRQKRKAAAKAEKERRQQFYHDEAVKAAIERRKQFYQD